MSDNKKSEPITKPATPPALASVLAGLSKPSKPKPAEAAIAETLAEIMQPIAPASQPVAESKPESNPVPANETEAQWSKRINREWQEREKARLAEAAKTPVVQLRPPTPPELPAETLEEFKSKLADHRQVNPNVRIVR